MGRIFVFFEIDKTKEKNVIVGVTSRPPELRVRELLNDLDRLFNIVSKENLVTGVSNRWLGFEHNSLTVPLCYKPVLRSFVFQNFVFH